MYQKNQSRSFKGKFQLTQETGSFNSLNNLRAG